MCIKTNSNDKNRVMANILNDHIRNCPKVMLKAFQNVCVFFKISVSSYNLVNAVYYDILLFFKTIY